MRQKKKPSPKPRYLAIADALRSSIRTGRLAPGQQVPSERRLAATWAASLSTVRRALAILKEDGLIVRRRPTGSYVTQAWQRRSPVVGLAFADAYDPEYPWLAKVILSTAKECTARGIGLELILYSEAPGKATAPPKLRIDGLILEAAVLPQSLSGFPSSGKPMVLFNMEAPGLDAPCVMSDHFGGVFEATAHLTELGHGRIGLLTGPNTDVTSSPAVLGYRGALAAEGIAWDDGLVLPSDWTRPAGRQAAHRLLSMDIPPTAIIAGDDVVATGVLDACADRGLKVPQNLSVVGQANLLKPEWHGVALTTVDIQLESMVREAVSLIARLIAGERPSPRKVVLPCRLIVRETTGPCGGRSPSSEKKANA